MYSLDANLFIYAAMRDSQFHENGRDFLSEQLASGQPCYICWPTVYAFIRIATNHHIWRNPLKPEEALWQMNAVLSLPQVDTLAASTHSWRVFENLSKKWKVNGKLVSDALVASILEANGIKRLFTHDSDFRKFPYLKPVDPFSN